jgi:hypothetical protein
MRKTFFAEFATCVVRETLIIIFLFASISFYLMKIFNPFMREIQIQDFYSNFFTALLPLQSHTPQHQAFLILHVFSIYELSTPIPRLQPV